jgi:pimeloyl-ACP methyl ester carboxylesterase
MIIIKKISTFLAIMSILGATTAQGFNLGNWYKKVKTYFSPQKTRYAPLKEDNPVWENHPYFNTTSLLDIHKTRKHLLKDGFQKVSFTASDGMELDGLFLERPNARANILVCSGYTVNLECMAPLSLMLPQDCNILLFNRRDNSSITSIRFIKQLYNYGGDQYKDIIAALDFLHLRNDNKIIMLGMSIGTYHSIHALRKLKEWSILKDYNIVGLIYDSGITTITQATKSLLQEPNQLTNHIYSSGIRATLFKAKHLFSTLLIRITLSLKKITKLGSIDKKISIFEQIKQLELPVFYIHTEQDRFPIDVIKKLDKNTKNSTHWWIKGSGHAVNHLKHKYEYARKINNFIKTSCTL